jgi:hypothetical protein
VTEVWLKGWAGDTEPPAEIDTTVAQRPGSAAHGDGEEIAAYAGLARKP